MIEVMTNSGYTWKFETLAEMMNTVVLKIGTDNIQFARFVSDCNTSYEIPVR